MYLFNYLKIIYLVICTYAKSSQEKMLTILNKNKRFLLDDRFNLGGPKGQGERSRRSRWSNRLSMGPGGLEGKNIQKVLEHQVFFCSVNGEKKEFRKSNQFLTQNAYIAFVCNRGDTILCSQRAPANKRKLGQSPASCVHCDSENKGD